MLEGQCTVSQVPQDRWSSDQFFDPDPTIPGKTYAQHAGIVDTAFDFDNGYFGVTRLEAEQLDPQQRVLLETVADALDHAGLNPSTLEKDRTGVFIGASSSDHSTAGLQDLDIVDAQYMLGNTLSILSNRIAYQWDFRGPSYTVDTACSSGLFALDQARRAIESGQVDTAIVGSVNMLLTPLPFVGFAKASMLSKTGLCQAFGAGADGYVRAEGAVVFVIQRKDVARVCRNRILSYVCATATNSDGRTAGLSMPSPDAQEVLLERIKSEFGIDPNDFAFIEAHGTGTPVGDPLEAQAIGRAYGQERSLPLHIGSAKTNFGHLEPASGLVGLLKAQFILEKGVIPPSLHAAELNPHIPFDKLGLDVVRQATVLAERDAPWLVGVNSFGFGGANAHAVLRQAEPQPAVTKAEMPAALRLTAQSDASLRALATKWRDAGLQAQSHGHEDMFGQQVANANSRLARHRHRLCVPAQSTSHLVGALDAWLERGAEKTTASGTASKDQARIGFVFSGNGAQWPGMGRHLFLSDPVFRTSFEKTSAIFQRLGAGSIIDMLVDSDLPARLVRAPVAQPLLLAIQIALVDSLARQGLVPHACLGHSAGEVAACYAAGALSREAAVQVIHARSQTMDQLFEKGRMAALVCSVETARALIDVADVAVDIAAENTETSLTVSGQEDDLKYLIKLARKERIVGKMLDIAYPYHSRFVDPLRTLLESDLHGISGTDTPIKLFSGCLGTAVPGARLNADYWWKNARDPVRFRDGIKAMAADGISMFVEISPKSVLCNYVRDTLEEIGALGEVLGSLEEQRAEEYDARRIAMTVLAHGGALDEEPLLGPEQAFVGGLPSYPFTRTEFRLGSEDGVDLFGRGLQHVLLGKRLTRDAFVWTGDLSLGRLPWLADHKVGGQVVLPGMAVLEVFTEAAAQIAATDRVELQNLELLRPVVLKAGQAVHTRVTYEPAARRLILETRMRGDWQIAAQAFSFENSQPVPEPTPLQPNRMDATRFYQALRDTGLEYGPQFARVDGFTKVTREQLVVHLRAGDVPEHRFRLNPLLSDAGLHAIAAFAPVLQLPGDVMYVPGRVGRIRVFGPAPIQAARLTLRSAYAAGICLDVAYLDADGVTVAVLNELRLRPMPRDMAARTLYWDELQVGAAPTGGAGLGEAIGDLTDRPTGNASDLDVIRDAIAGRLAWDIVACHSSEHVPDRRYDLAVTFLAGMDLAEVLDSGLVRLAESCPWPDIDTLIDLLAGGVAGAPDELHSTLGAVVSDHGAKETGFDLLRQATLAAINASAGLGSQVLLCGRIDPAIVLAAQSKAARVTVAAADESEAERLRLTLPGADTFLIVALDALPANRCFDTVLGVAVAESLSPNQQKSLSKRGAPGADLMLVETEPDLFELMTGRYRDASILDDLESRLRATTQDLKRSAWREASHVRFITASYACAAVQERRCFEIMGQGALAEGLRALCCDGPSVGCVVVLPRCADPVQAAVAQADALASLPPGDGMVWLVQEGCSHDATLRGWRRVLANETGRDIRCLSVLPGQDAGTVLQTISDSSEHELCLEGDALSTFRIAPAAFKTAMQPEQDRLVLSQTVQGRLEKLDWTVQPRQAPGPEDVEIEVAATGLNFRDVMFAQGVLPPEMLEAGFAGPTLGMECAGKVVRAGAASGFEPGQTVLAFAPSAFASHVTLGCDTVMALPDGMDPIAAATIPVIFFTAKYALDELARVRTGETVLIHGGAGGVGLAALQVAKRAGAIVYATAGSPEKRRLLEALGADAVFDSRTLTFASDIDRVTGGRGVDVVLNSLADEAMEASLKCLARFGRFVELGKRDFLRNTAIGLRALKDNISYFGVDADQLLYQRPEIAKRVMAGLLSGFEDEAHAVPPHRVFAADMVDDAFRLMQKSGHIGKIVVTPPKVKAVAQDVAPVDLSGHWLVVGGTGGFGLATAEWLAQQGAETLWLVSRSGKLDAPARMRLEAKGVKVELRSVDVTNWYAVDALLDEISQSVRRLGGIVHSAAHFDDARLDQADTAQIKSVLKAKLAGAHHLDRASRALAPRHFWMYSSVAARFGNPGQGAYVAANMGLEALARARRAEGLPALAVAWGPIGDAGYLGRAEELRKIVEHKMGRTLDATEALDALARALPGASKRATLTIAPVEWANLSADLPVVSGPLFECLNLSPTAHGIEGALDLVSLVSERGEAKARRAVLELLLGEASKIMRMAPAEIDANRPLTELGFDSLMGMNLKLVIEERLGADLPVPDIGAGISLARMAHDLVESVGRESTHANPGMQTLATVADQHLAGTEMSVEMRASIVASAGQD